jgi:hypothetical protein
MMSKGFPTNKLSNLDGVGILPALIPFHKNFDTNTDGVETVIFRSLQYLYVS